jgi:hypothetical protein
VSLKPEKVAVEPLKATGEPSGTPFFNKVTERMFAVGLPDSVMIKLVNVALLALGLVKMAWSTGTLVAPCNWLPLGAPDPPAT